MFSRTLRICGISYTRRSEQWLYIE